MNLSFQGYVTPEQMRPFTSEGPLWEFCGTNKLEVTGGFNARMRSFRGRDNPLNRRVVHTLQYDKSGLLDSLLNQWAQPFRDAGYGVHTDPTRYFSIGSGGRNLKVLGSDFGLEVLFLGNRVEQNRFAANVLGSFHEDGYELLDDKIEKIKIKKNLKLFTLSVPAVRRTRTYQEQLHGQAYQVITSKTKDPRIIDLAQQAFLSTKKIRLFD